MKTIFFLISVLLTGNLVQANCDIANFNICDLMKTQKQVNIGLHLSGRNMCKLRLLSSQNHPRTESLMMFLDQVTIKQEGQPVQAQINNNVIEISTGSIPYFVMDLEISSKDGSNLEEVIQKTLGVGFEGPIDTAVLQGIRCSMP
jgi:hypothetical protein